MLNNIIIYVMLFYRSQVLLRFNTNRYCILILINFVYSKVAPKYMNVPRMTDVLAGNEVSHAPWTSLKELKSATGMPFQSFATSGKWKKEIYKDFISETYQSSKNIIKPFTTITCKKTLCSL